MANLFKLVGSIFVDSDAADASLQKTDKNAMSVGQRLSAGIKTAGKWGAAIAAGATVAATAMIGLAHSTAETADAIDKNSDAMGISTEAYQEWEYVMGQCGMDIESMKTGMKTMSNLMQDAVSGSATAADTFDRLGVSIVDSEGNLKSQEQMMSDAIYALASMEEGAERTALANDLFGKSGVNMANMLNQGTEGITALTDRAHELGLVMSEEAVASGVQFGDLMADMKNSLGAMVARIGSAVMPILNKLLELLIKNLPTIQRLFDALAPVFTMMLEQLLPPLIELGEQIFPTLIDSLSVIIPIVAEITSELLPVITDLLSMLLPPLMEVVRALLPALLPLIEAVIPLLEPILELLEPILSVITALLPPIVSLITNGIAPLIEAIVRLVSAALVPVKGALETVLNQFESTFAGALEAVGPVIDALKGYLTGLIDFITGIFAGDWALAWQGVEKIFASVFDGIVAVAKGAVNLIIAALNGMLAGVETAVNFVISAVNKLSFEVPDWVPGIGGESFGFDLNKVNVAEIPYLAEGAEIKRAGQLFVANEKGPELVGSFDGRNAVINNRDVLDMIAQTVSQSTGSKNIERLLERLIEILLSLHLDIDGERLVSLIAPEIDSQLGAIKGGLRTT